MNRNRKNENLLVLSWTDWQAYEETLTSDRLIIKGVPSDFYAVTVFPQACMLMKKGGVLELWTREETDPLVFLSRYKSVAPNYGFEIQSPASDITGPRIFSFRYIAADQSSEEICYKSAYGYEALSRKLFQKVFGHTINTAYWNWKYPSSVENQTLVGIADGQLVAHYGIMSRQLKIDGKCITAAQVGDVMVDPDCRGGLGKSIFTMMAKHTMKQMAPDEELPYGRNAYCVGFGFPHGRKMKLAARMALYQDRGALNEVLIKASGQHSENSSDVEAFQSADERFRVCWEAAWQAMQSASPGICLINRNWQYLLSRYWFHPAKKYQFARVGEAVVVFQLETVSRLRILDYLGPLDGFVDTIRLLLTAFNRSEAICWIIQWQMEKLQDDGNIELINNSASLAVLFSENGQWSQYSEYPWWVTMGDTDFM